MKLEPLINADLVYVYDDLPDINALIKQVSVKLAGLYEVIDVDVLEKALHERESQGATSTPEGVAFPHAMIETLEETFVAACLLKPGVSFGRKDHGDSDLVFFLIGPRKSAWTHISILARLNRICHSPGALDLLRGATTATDLYEVLLAEDRKHG